MGLSVHRGSAFVALTLAVILVVWTASVRLAVAEGGRWTVWMPAPFGTWPATFEVEGGWSDAHLSLFASFALEGGGGGDAPILGQASAGSGRDLNDSHYLNGTRFVSGATAGRVHAISAYVVEPIDSAPNNRFALGIYDDAQGSPGVLVAFSEAGTLVGSGWHTVPIEAELEPHTPYWLFYTTNGTNSAVNNVALTPVVADPIDHFARHWRPAWLERAAGVSVLLGDMFTAGVLFLGLLSLRLREGRSRSIALLLAFGLGLGVVLVLKAALLPGYESYPSGHVFRATFVAVAAFEAFRGTRARAAAVLVVPLVGFSAIHLNGHNFDEVVGGLLLAATLVASVHALDRRPALAGGEEPRAAW